MTDGIADRLDAFEETLEHQQETIERQQETIERQEATIERQRERIAELEADASGGGSMGVPRRRVLQAGGALGLLGLGVGSASADPQGQVGTGDDPLNALYTEALDGPLTDDNRVESLVGAGLTIRNGRLTTVLEVPELAIDSIGVTDTYDIDAFVVDVTVAETADVATENLVVSLVVEDADGTVVYDASGEPGPVQNGTDTFTFGTDGSTDGVGPLDEGEYTATVAAEARYVSPTTDDEGFVVETAFDSGDGSEDNPYEIETWYDLDNVRLAMGDDFVMVADLDAGSEGYDEVAAATANGGSGFEPISDSLNAFSGTFDGDGHVVEGFVIDRTDETDVSLFGYNVGDIKRVGVVDVDVTGGQTVGGLVGENGGDVTDSYATGAVSAGGSYYGTTGYVGGLVGKNTGNVTDSYAIVDVSGNDYVGGLVGQNFGAVTDSYATGDVSGNSSVGGLVGASPGAGTVADSYWDVPASGTDGSGGGTGLGDLSDDPPADEMTGDSPLPGEADTMPDFDFEDTWATVTDPDDYPVLQAIGEDVQLEARG